MKLYHYLPKENNARKVGILTLSKKPEEIKKYGLDLSLSEMEMVKELGFDRIWDCGLAKYILTL